MRHEQIVQPARAREPGVERRIEHAGGIAQQALGMVERQRLHKGLWRQPGPAAEQMVEFIRRHAAASAIASMVGCSRQRSEMKAIARRTES